MPCLYLSEFTILALPIRIQYTSLTSKNCIYIQFTLKGFKCLLEQQTCLCPSEFSILTLPIRIQYTCLTYQSSVYFPNIEELYIHIGYLSESANIKKRKGFKYILAQHICLYLAIRIQHTCTLMPCQKGCRFAKKICQ